MFTHDQLVEIVRTAAGDVFTTMLAVTAEPEAAYTESCAAPTSNGVISLIGLAGPLAGTGSISCTANAACWIASQLMMTEYAAVNMIIGNVKTALEETCGAMGLSIPTVIYGRNFMSRTVGQQEWTIVPFTANGEKIEIHLCLAPSRDASRPRVAIVEPQTVEV
jgi:chemotaxis protein CheX